MLKRDLKGRKFGRLTPITDITRTKSGHRLWQCTCTCGNTVNVSSASLQSSNTRSCGCLRKQRVAQSHYIHGHARQANNTPTYLSWCRMKSKCVNVNNRTYKNYGKRGIRVCTRWLSFPNFLTDMGECPQGASLKRINKSKHYEPGNCKWISRLKQA